ncbi:MAG: FAD-dependent oxidoreductase, partial [Spiribacter salinus]
MTAGPYRLAEGGLGIDREAPVAYTWNKRPHTGYQGDTLASALLANGERVIARSFKYHRPRGIYTIGSEEPGGLVTIGEGARQDPNLKAPTVALHDALEARSQNCWPSPRFDLMSINGLAAPLFVAGFYYKTFMRPASWWEPVYERVIRRAAGLGHVSTQPDPDTYVRAEAHCDVLVVGAGAAGIEAARTAARSGARVMLVEERPWLGGRLAMEPATVGEQTADAWVTSAEEELDAADRVTVLRQTVAFGLYDHRIVGLVETLAPASINGSARQRYWTIKAEQIVFATGALEQPLAFAGNDRPGVMLAAAARGYAHRFGVAVGRRVVVVGGDDEGVETAMQLQRAGVNVVALVDSRPAEALDQSDPLAQAGIRHMTGAVATRA